MEALIRFLQNNKLIILVMFIITLLGGLMGIILGWKRFYDDFLSKSITLPVYVLIILFVVVALAIIFRPAIKDRPKGLKTIKGESFGVQRIVVDGKRFVNCTFRKTELVFRGETSGGFEGCSLEYIGLTFDGPAANTAKLLAGLYTVAALRPLVENTFKAIREGKLPIATPPSDAADG
ncbi:hypothetical protein ES703_125633 [subsurface metagenome]